MGVAPEPVRWGMLSTARIGAALVAGARQSTAADVVMFALTRPRSMRLMTTTFRPMSEGSWG